MNQFVKTYLRARRNAKWYDPKSHELLSPLVNDEDKLIAIEKRPSLIGDIEPSENLIRSVIINEPRNIKYMKNVPDDLKYYVVDKYPKLIEFIENPSEELQLLAIKYNRSNIKFIENPTEKVQLIVLNYSDSLFSDIKNPTENVKLDAVTKDHRHIVSLKNPSEELQLIAIKKYPPIIQYIKNPTEMAQLEALRLGGSFLINYIAQIHRTPEVERLSKELYRKEQRARGLWGFD